MSKLVTGHCVNCFSEMPSDYKLFIFFKLKKEDENNEETILLIKGNKKHIYLITNPCFECVIEISEEKPKLHSEIFAYIGSTTFHELIQIKDIKWRIKRDIPSIIETIILDSFYIIKGIGKEIGKESLQFDELDMKMIEKKDEDIDYTTAMNLKDRLIFPKLSSDKLQFLVLNSSHPRKYFIFSCIDKTNLYLKILCLFDSNEIIRNSFKIVKKHKTIIEDWIETIIREKTLKNFYKTKENNIFSIKTIKRIVCNDSLVFLNFNPEFYNYFVWYFSILLKYNQKNNNYFLYYSTDMFKNLTREQDSDFVFDNLIKFYETETHLIDKYHLIKSIMPSTSKTFLYLIKKKNFKYLENMTKSLNTLKIEFQLKYPDLQEEIDALNIILEEHYFELVILTKNKDVLNKINKNIVITDLNDFELKLTKERIILVYRAHEFSFSDFIVLTNIIKKRNEITNDIRWIMMGTNLLQSNIGNIFIEQYMKTTNIFKLTSEITDLKSRIFEYYFYDNKKEIRMSSNPKKRKLNENKIGEIIELNCLVRPRIGEINEKESIFSIPFKKQTKELFIMLNEAKFFITTIWNKIFYCFDKIALFSPPSNTDNTMSSMNSTNNNDPLIDLIRKMYMSSNDVIYQGPSSKL